MEIYIYQAECGDATRIRFFGSDGKQHNIFIDAGFERTFRNILRSDIKSIKVENEAIDLCIVSHIHDDHIGGIIGYINAINAGEESDIVNEWFYNPPRYFQEAKSGTPNEISSAKSVRQGDELLSYLVSHNKRLTSEVCSDFPVIDFFGLTITILSPDKKGLLDLRKKYESVNAINYEEFTLISEAKSAIGYDYKKRLVEFDIDEWEEDDSIENKSSISLLMDFHGKKFLWLADSHPSTIIASLDKLGYSRNNPLVCEWVKVSHHGSKSNNSTKMYSLIHCNNYILSVNGENKSYLPSKECLAKILRNPNRSKDSYYKFHFTYDNATLRSIFSSDGNDIFHQFRFYVQYQKDKRCDVLAHLG